MLLKLHIGNVSDEITSQELRALFAHQGPVSDVKVVAGLSRGRPRKFAFVTMGTEAAAKAAVQALNGQILGDRFITVSEAHDREDNPLNTREYERHPRRSLSQLF